VLARGFIKLLKRYKEETLPAPVRKAMDGWYRSLDNEPVEKNQKPEIGDRIWLGIKEGLEHAGDIPLAHHPSFWQTTGMWKVAATVLIVMGTLFYFTRGMFYKPNMPVALAWKVNVDWVKIINREAAPREVILPDGSKVVLENGSELRYPKKFDTDSRVVFLEGNGFFDVRKNSASPFLVYSGAVLTRVLGTSFTIRSIPKTGGTEVAVVTGKVMVEKTVKVGEGTDVHGGNRIVLTPNKKVTFFRDSDLYVTGLVAKPEILPDQPEYLKPQAFYFDETPLAVILSKLEEAYGVDISLSDDSIMGCVVTADLTSDHLYEKIEIIAAILNARYEITGNSILITGGGCNQLKPSNKL
jgi:transmembrane sensor